MCNFYLISNRPPCTNQILSLLCLRSKLSVENGTSLWTFLTIKIHHLIKYLATADWMKKLVRFKKKPICFKLHWIVNIKKYPSKVYCYHLLTHTWTWCNTKRKTVMYCVYILIPMYAQWNLNLRIHVNQN